VRRLIALALVVAASDVAYRAPEHVVASPPPPPPAPAVPIAAPLDVRACELDLGAGAAKPHSLADLPAERGGPPPVSTRIALVDHATAVATAAKLAAALPKRWRPHIELDSAAMASLVELYVPGEHSANDLAPAVLGFVRAHACLFGVTDPSALAAHATGDQHQGTWVLIDVAPRSVGAIQADIDADHGVTRVQIHQHQWPVADPPIAMDPAKFLKRYIGVSARIQIALIYMIDPKTRRHTGCVPRFGDITTDASRFHFRIGPVLVCHGRIADVQAGAFVWMPYSTGQHAPVLDELPTAVDPAGNRFGDAWIAPALRTPTDDDIAYDQGACPVP